MSVLDLPLEALQPADELLAATTRISVGKVLRRRTPHHGVGTPHHGVYDVTADSFERYREDALYDEASGPARMRHVQNTNDPVGEVVAIRIGATQQVLANYATVAMLRKRPRAASTIIGFRDKRAHTRRVNAILKASAAANREAGAMVRGTARVRNDDGELVARIPVS